MGLPKAVRVADHAVANIGGARGQRILATAQSPILQGGQLVIAGLRRTTGSGQPADGVQFGEGGRRFADAAEVLAGAGATDDWTGSGSDAYRGDNGRQHRRAAVMAGIDRGVQRVIARAAAQISSCRGQLDDRSDWLADVGRTTSTLGLIPGFGPALKTAAETRAVAAAVGACAVGLQSLAGEVDANAGAISQLIADYQVVVDETPTAGLHGPKPAPPPDHDDHDEGGDDPPPGADGAEPGAEPHGTNPDGRGAIGGGPSGSGPSNGGGAPAPAPVAVPNPSLPPMTGARPAPSSGTPAGVGGPPSTLGGSPPSVGSGVTASEVGQLIRAAVERALDERDTKDETDTEEDDEADADTDADDETDAEATEPETVLTGAAGPLVAEHGRAPVHVEFDVDPRRLDTPMTVTLDRDRAIVVPPTVTA